MRTHLARFPFVKRLESFDFGYQPSLNKKQLQTLSSCHFIEHGENVVLLGPPRGSAQGLHRNASPDHRRGEPPRFMPARGRW